MADNAALDSFLAQGTPQEPAQPPAAPPAPESTPDPSSTPTEAPAKPSEGTPEPEEDVAPHSGSDSRMVPFATLEKTRNDWKSRFAAEQARAELLAKQLEEAKRPPTTPTPQAAPLQQYIAPPPDPRVDPAGWAQDFAVRAQHAMLNERLNTSETMLRDKLGDAKVDEYVGAFKAAAEKDPQLFGKLYSQPAPYQWLVREMDRQRAHADIGDDPAAYRSKLEAELRAKWEQEVAEQSANGGNGRTVTVSPAAGLPPSLANARSVAGRTAPTFTGPPPLEELFPGHNRRGQRR